MRKKRFLGLVWFVVMMVGLPLVASAQGEPEVIINFVNTEEDGDRLAVDLFFSLQNGGDIDAAYVLLDDGSRYEATVGGADLPYFIALVLDASGSLSGVEDDMRQAAIAAVDAAPAGARFAVLSFNETITLLQDFTSDRTNVINAINSIQIENKSTCLYDVAFTALEALEQIATDAPQRAMILFTDGRDELTNGQGDTCSENTPSQLVALASNQNTTIPIHTVGLSGGESSVASDDLANLSLATGGLSVVVDEEMNVSSFFGNVMAELGSQWVAHSEVWAPAGIRTATLYLTLQDGTLVQPDTSFFSAERDYLPLIEPEILIPTILVEHFEYNTSEDQFFSTIFIDRPQAIGSLRVELWNIQTNQEIGEPILENVFLATENDIIIPTLNLEPQSVYAMRVYAFNQIGVEIRDEFNQIIRVEHVFQYSPPSALSFTMDSLTIDEDNNQLVVNLFIENGQTITQYNGQIIDQATNTTAYEFGPNQRFGNTVYVPLELDESGRYVFNIEAYEADGDILATASYEFEYTAPANIFLSAYTALLANPILFAFFGLIALLIILLEALILVVTLRRRYIVKPEEEEEEQTSRLTGNVTGLPFAKIRVEKSLASNFVGNEFEINYVPFSIGREGADLDIPGDRGISREHAVITYENKAFMLKSMSSTGTIINDSTVPERESVMIGEEERTSIRLGRGTQLAFITEVRNPDGMEDEAVPELPTAIPV